MPEAETDRTERSRGSRLQGHLLWIDCRSQQACEVTGRLQRAARWKVSTFNELLSSPVLVTWIARDRCRALSVTVFTRVMLLSEAGRTDWMIIGKAT